MKDPATAGKAGGRVAPPADMTASDGSRRGAGARQERTPEGATDRSVAYGSGVSGLAPAPDTYSRVRAVCTGAPGINLDKHAAKITEVVTLARLRSRRSEFTGRGDEVSSP